MANSSDLKKIDLEIMERLLLRLYESGRTKTTTIARNTKMSYNRCVAYLDCLEMLDFVSREKDGRSVLFVLTQHGIIFCKKKLGIA